MDVDDHVLLGAGAVCMAVVEALARRGESVRVVNRSGLREPIAGVQSVTGDITDPAFAASATSGARGINQALNPPHDRWARDLPRSPSRVGYGCRTDRGDNATLAQTAVGDTRPVRSAAMPARGGEAQPHRVPAP